MEFAFGNFKHLQAISLTGKQTEAQPDFFKWCRKSSSDTRQLIDIISNKFKVSKTPAAIILTSDEDDVHEVVSVHVFVLLTFLTT